MSRDDTPPGDMTADQRPEPGRPNRWRRPGPGGRRIRTGFAVVVLLLGVLLTPAAVVAVWADAEIRDQDGYVRTVAPLAHDPAIRTAVTDRITDAAMDAVDSGDPTSVLGEFLRRNGLPPELAEGASSLLAPLREAVRDFVHEQVAGVVSGPVFPELWDAANRQAHRQVVDALTGDGGALEASGDTVTLALDPILDSVRGDLAAAGFPLLAEAIPDTGQTIVLLRSDAVGGVRTALHVIDAIGGWIAPLAAVVLAVGVWAAPARRRAVLGAGLGVVAATLLLLLAVALARRAYLDDLPPDIPRSAGAAVYDTLVRHLRSRAGTVLTLAAVAAVAALAYGPSRAATAIRRRVSGLVDRAGRAAGRAGLRTGAAGRWIARYRVALSFAAVTLASAGLALWSHPTPGVVLLLAGLVLVVLVLLELAAAAAPPASGGKGPPGVPYGDT